MPQHILKPAFAAGTLAAALGISLLTPATASASEASSDAQSIDCQNLYYPGVLVPCVEDQVFTRPIVFHALKAPDVKKKYEDGDGEKKKKKKSFTRTTPTHEKKKSKTRKVDVYEKKKSKTRKGFTIGEKKKAAQVTRALNGKKAKPVVFKTMLGCQTFGNKMAQKDRLTTFECLKNKNGHFRFIAH
jgi:hypothetical protein